jgi:hypothetical protein
MKLETVPQYNFIRNIVLNNGVITIEYGGGQQVTIDASELIEIG